MLSAVITKAKILTSAVTRASQANNMLLNAEINAPINKDLITPK